MAVDLINKFNFWYIWTCKFKNSFMVDKNLYTHLCLHILSASLNGTPNGKLFKSFSVKFSSTIAKINFSAIFVDPNFTFFFANIDGEKNISSGFRILCLRIGVVKGAMTEILWDKIVEGGARNDVFFGIVDGVGESDDEENFGGAGVWNAVAVYLEEDSGVDCVLK